MGFVFFLSGTRCSPIRIGREQKTAETNFNFVFEKIVSLFFFSFSYFFFGGVLLFCNRSSVAKASLKLST